MIDYKNYFIWEGVKTFLAGFLLLFTIVLGYQLVKKIETQLLETTLNSRSGDGDSSSSANVKSQNSKQPKSSFAKRAILILKKKFYRFAAVAGLASLVQIANSLIVWGVFNDENEQIDLTWHYDIIESPDIIQMILKIIILSALVIMYFFFKVPSLESDSSKADVVPSTSDGNSFSHTNTMTNTQT